MFVEFTYFKPSAHVVHRKLFSHTLHFPSNKQQLDMCQQKQSASKKTCMLTMQESASESKFSQIVKPLGYTQNGDLTKCKHDC